MMDTEERDLERMLQGAVEGVDTSANFAGTTIAKAHRARRRRAVVVRTSVAVVGVAASVGLASALGSWSGSRGDPEPASTPGSKSTQSTVAPDAGLEAWLDALPRGANTRLPYVLHGELFTGTSAIDLGDVDAEYVGEVSGGRWIVFLEGRNGRGSYASVSPDGAINELPDGGYRLQNAAVAPDGSRVVYGSEVREVGSWHAVAAVPDNAVAVVGWTARGIIFNDGANRSWLWDVAGEPQPLNEHLVAVSESGDVGITRLTDSDCSKAISMSTGATIFEGCGSDAPIAVSPDGSSFVTTGLSVHAPDGPVDLGVPDSVLDSAAVGWETADDVVLALVSGGDADRGPADGPPRSSVGTLVRCSVSARECERASDRLTVPADDELLLTSAAR